jgi:hypothetical protein
MLKPMFDSQKTKNAAQTVAAALQRVRFKAMEKQTTYGILFEPFNGNPVAVQMRLVTMGNNEINNSIFRIKIVSGTVYLYKFTTSGWSNSSSDVTQGDWEDQWNSKVERGYKIQLGRQGRLFDIDNAKATISSSIYPTLAFPYDTLTLPENSSSNDAMEYSIIQPPRTSLTPPVVLPRGTVIDLKYSDGYSGARKVDFDDINGQKILFTPNGYVDYFDGTYNPFYGGLIYFCIGEWERQIDNTTGKTLAEDNKNNIETITNFWVTLHPKTGQIRITEMAPASGPGDIQGARKFAAEHFGINE